MSEKMSRSELSHQDKKLIEDILLKSPEKLDHKEKAVLRSRRAYLTSVEERIFAEVLEDKKEVVEVKKEKKKPGRRKK
jgi:hypothetical protein